MPTLSRLTSQGSRAGVGGLVLLAVTHSAALAQAARPSPADPGWPREVTSAGASLTYYQPQLDGWKDYQDVTARVAFSLVPSGGTPGSGRGC